MADAGVQAVDPFDLPDWLGEHDVTWTALTTVRGARHVMGVLSAGADTLDCDLMAADVAYPSPVLPEQWRRQAHLAWEHGQVLLLVRGGRLTLAVPGTAYSADGALETISRLAKALGVAHARFTVALRL